VYLDSAQENLLRAQGLKIGEVVFDADDFAARRAEINAATDGEKLAAEVASRGLTQAAKSNGAVWLMVTTSSRMLKSAWTEEWDKPDAPPPLDGGDRARPRQPAHPAVGVRHNGHPNTSGMDRGRRPTRQKY